MGLVIFGAIALYLIVSIIVVVLAAKVAKKRGRSPWRWGGAAALVMYLLVFWDHIPTVLAHKYYCEKEAGFWVYKTLDQWKAENPGVAETLTWKEVRGPSDTIRLLDGGLRDVLNVRFSRDRVDTPIPLLSTTKHEQRFVDMKTKEVLGKRVSISSGYGNLALGGNDWRVVKFWLSLDPCVPEIEKFSRFYSEVQQLGGKE